MLAFLGAAENLAFTLALITMLLIGAVEAVGLGGSALGHDFDMDTDADWLHWLGFGRLPLLMTLVVFLACFGVIGLTGQQLALDRLGALLSPWLAIPAAGAAALPLTGIMVRLLARILPRDETSAIGVDELVGLPAEILVGRATAGSPAKARVRDRHGQAHYVMVEPDDPAVSFGEGDRILLCRQENGTFRAITNTLPDFSNWITR